jgi:hypothetical protein
VLGAGREAPGCFNLIISRLQKKHASHVSQRCLSSSSTRGGYGNQLSARSDSRCGKAKKACSAASGRFEIDGQVGKLGLFCSEALRAHDRPCATSIEATTSCTFHTRRRAEFDQSRVPGPLKVKWVCFAKRLAGTGIGTIGKGEPPIWRRIRCVLNAIHRSNS